MSKSPFRLRAPMVSEHSLQAQIAKLLTLEIAPAGKVSKAGVCWFACDHANYAGEVPGVRVGRGIIAGLADLWFIYRGRVHCVELKAADGELSLEQMSVSVAITIAGARVGVACSPEQVLDCLDEWGIPRHRRVTLAA